MQLTEHQKSKGYQISSSGKLVLPHKVNSHGLNERVSKMSLINKAKDRHERRHNNGPKTSKSEALEHMKTMSKDYGKIRQ